jgi:hypothetical protein
MYLFCDVLCIVCVYMCTELLPPGGYPIAVKYIIYHFPIHPALFYSPVSSLKKVGANQKGINNNIPIRNKGLAYNRMQPARVRYVANKRPPINELCKGGGKGR